MDYPKKTWSFYRFHFVIFDTLIRKRKGINPDVEVFTRPEKQGA